MKESNILVNDLIHFFYVFIGFYKVIHFLAMLVIIEWLTKILQTIDLVTHHLADFLVGGNKTELNDLISKALYHLSENNWGKGKSKGESLVKNKNETALEDLAEYINGRMTDQNWYELIFEQLVHEKS